MTESDDDNLRARLSRMDPIGPETTVNPATSSRAAELMERAMQGAEAPRVGKLSAARRRRRRPVLWLAGAAAIAASGLGIFFTVDRAGPDDAGRPTTLALSLPPSDVMASCIPFELEYLRDMPLAFAGTVTAADGEQVTLDIEHWYRGSDVDEVTIAVPAGQTSAALDGVDFRAGERYLVAATDGTVNGCGFSGPATPQLEGAYADAFGA